MTRVAHLDVLRSSLPTIRTALTASLGLIRDTSGASGGRLLRSRSLSRESCWTWPSLTRLRHFVIASFGDNIKITRSGNRVDVSAKTLSKVFGHSLHTTEVDAMIPRSARIFQPTRTNNSLSYTRRFGMTRHG